MSLDKRTIRKILVGDFTTARFIGSLVFIYVCFMLFAYFYSNRMIFPTPRSSYEDGPDIIKIETADGEKISALYLHHPNSEFTILYSHGNAEDIGHLRGLLKAFQDRGFSVLAYDYRGYGTSEGRPTEKNTYEDIEAAYRYLVGELGVPADRIIALGRSVGGAVAVHLAGREKLAGLIVESSFTSAFVVLTRVPLVPFDRFRNIDKIKKVHCPILIIHGTKDMVIPLAHGEKLFEAANEPKLKFWVEGAGHNDLFWAAGDNYWEIINEFTNMIKSNRED